MKLWVGVVLAVMALRLVLAATTGIVEDEAYYWTWSQRLAAGYYDHPPAIAYLIASSNALFGATSLGVRATCVVLGSLIPLLLLRFTKDPSLLVLLLLGLPLYTLGGVLATPDVPLLFGWTLALAGACSGAWGLTGVGIGLASLGKYTGWGLWPLLIAAEIHEYLSDRQKGRRPQFPGVSILAGMAVTAVMIAPNLWWNREHDWASIRFQAGHGLGGKGIPAGPGLWWLGQAGLVTPLLFLAMAIWWVGGLKREGKIMLPGQGWDRVDRIAWWTSLPVVVFFGLAAMRTHGEPNWTAPAWIGACLGLSRAGLRLRTFASLGGGFAAMLSLGVMVHLYIPLVDFKGDPTARLGVGSELAESVNAWGPSHLGEAGGYGPVYTNRYQEAALLRYYRNIEAYALPGVERADQFDLWPVRWSEQALFVRPWRGSSTVVIEEFCGHRGSPNLVTQHNIDGSTFERWQVYEVQDCGRRGSVPAGGE